MAKPALLAQYLASALLLWRSTWPVARYHIRKEQLVEAGLYLFIITAAIVVPVLRKFADEGNAQETPAVCHPGAQGRARNRSRLEPECRAARIRHGRKALVVAGRSARDARHRPRNDRIGKDHPAQEHHHAGHCASRWSTRGSPPHPDRHLRWQRRPRILRATAAAYSPRRQAAPTAAAQSVTSRVLCLVQPFLHARRQLHGAGEHDLRQLSTCTTSSSPSTS